MSVAEIKEAITRLPAEGRAEIEQFLRARRLAESPEYRARVERAHRQIDSRHSVTLDQLRQLIEQNQEAARRAS